MNPVINADNASFRRPPDPASKRQPDCQTDPEIAFAVAPMTAIALQNGLADGTIGPSRPCPKAPPPQTDTPPPPIPHRPKRPRRRA
jgi:hypothetical protein